MTMKFYLFRSYPPGNVSGFARAMRACVVRVYMFACTTNLSM